MSPVTLWHNPRCSKSRAALALLEEKGADIRVVEYLKEPPTTAQLDRALQAMGREPLEAMRTGEARFKELGLAKDDKRPRKEWLALMSENPILIERPIALCGDKAAMGRPPEAVLTVLTP